MTEHEEAVNAALNFECKKDGMRQSQSGDWKLTLTVQALDMPTEVLTALMGDRFMCVMVALDEGEEPIKIAEKPKNNNVIQAAMMVKENDYKQFLICIYNKTFYGCHNSTDLSFKKILNIDSKREVAEGQKAIAFKNHVSEFNTWKRNR